MSESKIEGFDLQRLAKVDALLSKGVEDKLFPSAVYSVSHRREVVASGAFGVSQPDSEEKRPANLKTLYDLASITKTFTGVLLLLATEDGLLHLGLKVQDLLPEAKTSPVANVTLTQLATHTSGLPPWKPLYRTSDPLHDILQTSLEAEPGTRYAYSDLGYVLLTKILERVTYLSFDKLVRTLILDPLSLTETCFNPASVLHSRIATTANCPMREGKTLIGEVHDANAYSMKGISGHAGLFSTVGEVTRYAEGLSTLLRRLTLPKVAESQIPESVGGHSIGWFTATNSMLPSGDFFSNQCFGHTGFTGTMLIIEPKYELTLVLLTNRVYYPSDATRALRLRRYFSNLIASAVK